jgi:5-methylcytosine-specific restriction endonuclease McrA
MLFACSRCGRVHDKSFDCKAGARRRYSNTEENKLRSQYSWKVKRQSVRERANYLCEVCKDQGDYHPKAIEIHHIIKLKDDPDGLLDDRNLIALCVDHHKQADRGEIDISYLRALADKRDEVGEGYDNRWTPPQP